MLLNFGFSKGDFVRVSFDRTTYEYSFFGLLYVSFVENYRNASRYENNMVVKKALVCFFTSFLSAT